MDITEVQHDAITTENRAGLATHMEKFDSFEAAALDGMSLKSQMGKPFRMPKSFDGMDDAGKADFNTQVDTLRGVTRVKSIDDLKALDLKLGSKNDTPADEGMAGLLKDYAVKNNLSVKAVQNLIEFNNGPLGDHVAKIQEANAEKALETDLAARKAVNDALVSDPDFGTQDKVDEQSKLFNRAISEKLGMSADELTEAKLDLGNSPWVENPKLAKLLLQTFAPMATESSLDTNNAHKPGGNTAVVDPDLGCPSQLATGLCTPEENAAWNARQAG